jgi:hypothetical protein
MKIKFYSDGGFAGLRRQLEIDSANLSEELMKAVTFLLQNKSNYQNLKSKSLARDLLKYTITFEEAEDSTVFCFDDSTLPQEISILLRFLSKHAKPK